MPNTGNSNRNHIPQGRRLSTSRHINTTTNRQGLPTEAMDDNRWIVFVSSAMPKQRSRQIYHDRHAAKKAAATYSQWFRVWTWEDCAFPGRFSPDDLYLSKAAESHILILLIHDRLTKNTKREYDISVRNRRGQMVFFRDGFRLKQTARNFKDKLRHTTYWQYTNRSELKSIVIRGLRENLLRYANLGQNVTFGTKAQYVRPGV
jgi:hypothetical protein